uniref:tRNA N(3)-methylcytidine methyltransferase n=1 Tax=Kalanchoe fedtschenkoi TaxID=63787 RepID=A0A7N0V1C2_KALFE
METEAHYFSKDFEWEQLRREVESDPSLRHHLLPPSSSSVLFQPPSQHSDAWNRFHIRHSTGKFFKERRYLLKEFPELTSGHNFKLLEVGCGNGSTALPILRNLQNITVYACDSSSKAIERASHVIQEANLDSVNHRFHPFLCDFSVQEFPKWIFCDFCRQNSALSCQDASEAGMDSNDISILTDRELCIGGVDFVTLIFTLSAVPPDRMLRAITECFNALKPGGLIFFRDYGLYDMTMLRFDPSQKLGAREYVRSDGTLSYFFCLDTVRKLFTDVGFKELDLDYCCVKSVNRRKGKSMRRVWVHGKFQKPIGNTGSSLHKLASGSI